MNRGKTSLYVFMLILGLATFAVGCGGGGGGVSPAGPSTKVSIITGIVSDGPINNARVFLDLNHNGKYEEGEPFSITTDKGEFKIEYILDSGTDYLIVAEGSSALMTEDLKDNPADGTNLTFVMFLKMTAIGSRNSESVSAVYRQDVTPVTFRNYLKANFDGIDDTNIQNIIESSDTDGATIFKNTIKDKKIELTTTAQLVGTMVKSSNDNKDLGSTITELSVASDSQMNFSDKAIADLANSFEYKNKTFAKIGDIVIAKPLQKVSAADVIITNMFAVETNQGMTLTVKPSTLSNYSVSVTRYQSILEIPEFSQIKGNNYSVVLGGDITCRDNNGVKDNNQTLGAWITSGSGAYDDLEYLYFNGSLWVNGGQVNTSMTIKTAPFVIVKKNSVIEKTINVTGLSLMANPVVVVKGYYSKAVTRTSVALDAVALSQISDNLSVKIPENFIISEVVVVNTELRNITADKKVSMTIAVTDSDQTTTVSTSLSMGKTKFILNQDVFSTLKDGNQEQDFPGLGSFIDTKMVYRGVDMFLGLNINDSVKQIINENANRYLDPTIMPTFYSGTGKFDGVTIDSAQKIISVTLVETDQGGKVADIRLTWSFAKNKVVRSYKKYSIGGDKKGSTYDSIYTYSTGTDLANVVFLESIYEIYVSTSGYTQQVSASYEGTAIYERNIVDNSIKRLISAKFDQKHSESNSFTKQTNTIVGLVTMKEINTTEGNLDFNGQYSLFLLSYGLVSGTVTVADLKYAEGYNTYDRTYYNNNTLNEAKVLFTSQSDYLDYTVAKNPSWIKGIWGGEFTDSCSENNLNGQLSMSVTDTTATWWGQSYDMSRNYGTAVEVYGASVRLKDDTALWANGVKISDTRIEGSWLLKGCKGSFVLDKT